MNFRGWRWYNPDMAISVIIDGWCPVCRKRGRIHRHPLSEIDAAGIGEPIKISSIDYEWRRHPNPTTSVDMKYFYTASLGEPFKPNPNGRVYSSANNWTFGDTKCGIEDSADEEYHRLRMGTRYTIEPTTWQAFRGLWTAIPRSIVALIKWDDMVIAANLIMIFLQVAAVVGTIIGLIIFKLYYC